MARCGWV